MSGRNATQILLLAALAIGGLDLGPAIEEARARRTKGQPPPPLSPPRSRHDAVREVVDRGTFIDGNTWVFACPLCRFRRTYATDSGVTTRAVEHVQRRHPEVA
jgi:hypothetical protein